MTKLSEKLTSIRAAINDVAVPIKPANPESVKSWAREAAAAQIEYDALLEMEAKTLEQIEAESKAGVAERSLTAANERLATNERNIKSHMELMEIADEKLRSWLDVMAQAAELNVNKLAISPQAILNIAEDVASNHSIKHIELTRFLTIERPDNAKLYRNTLVTKEEDYHREHIKPIKSMIEFFEAELNELNEVLEDRL